MLEEDGCARVRVDKIYDIIEACRFGIPDVSRTELDPTLGLPRFNMPLELGVFLGARCVVLDRERFRYQAYLSDLSGQDIKAHGDDPVKAFRAVRDWPSQFTPENALLLGARKMTERYALFLADLPALLIGVGIERDALIYNDYTTLVVGWITANPR